MNEKNHEKNYYWTEWLHQENEIFSSRLNLLLVGESMLLISYVSAFNLDASVKSWLPFTLCVLGFFVTVVFAIIIFEHAKYITKLEKKIKEDFPEVSILKENPVGDITKFLSLTIPFVFILFWFIFSWMSPIP